MFFALVGTWQAQVSPLASGQVQHHNPYRFLFQRCAQSSSYKGYHWAYKNSSNVVPLPGSTYEVMRDLGRACDLARHKPTTMSLFSGRFVVFSHALA